MKKIKLLIPIMGFTSLTTVALPLSSCGGGTGGQKTETYIVSYGSTPSGLTWKSQPTEIKKNTALTVTYEINSQYSLSSATVTVGGTDVTSSCTVTATSLTVPADKVTGNISITITTTSAGEGIKVITTDTTITSGSFKSTSSDQNAVLVNGKISANLSNLTLNKTGDCSSTEESSFTGYNSALLAKGGSTTVLDKLTVTTNASGANGVFAYGGNQDTKSGSTGDGTNITISNSTINTSQGNSGGIMVAGHGQLTANNCTVTTQGDSSAAIRSDRGGDKMTVTGGTYTSNGKGSPAIYATATINVSDATLKSTTSEGVILEGSNKVVLNNCSLEDTNCKHNSDKSSEYKNIFLYQSQSGDAGSGHDYFTATDCKITTHQGDDIYVTNQTTTIDLTNNTFTNDWTPTSTVTQQPYFLRCKIDGWGKTGQNGGHATLNANNQVIGSTAKPGNIDIDSISTLALNLKTGSAWTGALTNANQSTDGVVVTIDSTSSWTLTADSYVGSIDSTSLDKVTVNGHKLYGWNGSAWTVIKE